MHEEISRLTAQHRFDSFPDIEFISQFVRLFEKRPALVLVPSENIPKKYFKNVSEMIEPIFRARYGSYSFIYISEQVILEHLISG